MILGRLEALVEDAGEAEDEELAEVASLARDVIADAIDAHEYVVEPDDDDSDDDDDEEDVDLGLD